jgi:uncharacterized protein YjdB
MPSVDRVEFDRHAATLYAGDVLPTSVSVSKTDGEVVAASGVTYASSDSTVATVDSTGTVYTHVAGEALITAAVGSVADTLDVTVTWPPVTVLAFGYDSLTLAVGDTFPDYLTVLNSHGNLPTYATVTFSSSAPSVAAPVDSTVRFGWEEGRIAAIGEGRAVITARVGDISDTLAVTVVPVRQEPLPGL